MKVKYAKNNKEALKQIKVMEKGDILVFDEAKVIKKDILKKVLKAIKETKEITK